MQSGISSVLLKQLFQELPSSCLETFKCLNEFIVLHVGTESNIVGMIITGFVYNLFIVEDFFSPVDQNNVWVLHRFWWNSSCVMRSLEGLLSERIETLNFASDVGQVNKS